MADIGFVRQANSLLIYKLQHHTRLGFMGWLVYKTLPKSDTILHKTIIFVWKISASEYLLIYTLI